MLPKASSVEMANTERYACKLLNNGQVDQNDKGLDRASERQDLEGKELKQETTLHELEPVAVHALHELVSLVHNHVNAAEQYDFE
ncbi:hypothetical protein ABKV19_003801 [Rosa sericea]